MADGRHLQRKLKSRHLTMISLGGAIGTGLFLGSGSAIHDAGPGGALLAYVIIGFMIYFIMTSLGELAAYMPVSGSFSTYATRFIDPALGFALGWNYWYSWAITIAAELSAAAVLMKFWFPHTSPLLWSALFLIIIFLLNYLSVRGYGEGEYWFAFIKVATVIIFIVVGLLMIFGIMGGHAVGFKNFTVGDAPFPGGVMGTLGVFLVAGFSFQGTEIVGVAAGESDDPRRNVPRAIRSIFWRILLFYILAILVIGLIIPYYAKGLSVDNNIFLSPFTIVFKRAGLAFAASVMNAVILTAVLSAGNSSLYASTRMLYAMAEDGQAPKFLARLNKRGIPIGALILTTVVGMLAFLTSIYGTGEVYQWLLNASAVTGFIFWIGIAVSHLRFRKAYVAQGRSLKDLPYRSKWYPFGPLFAFVLCLIVLLAQDYQAFLAHHINWMDVTAAYLGIPLFLVMWFGYKIIKRTRVIPLKECQLDDEGA
ncbi:amino acid permease [Camelliibacillus cellulosilyticus]|uniref:Amino acid permease n=1 Tax=Camelliibacillus cellulosilyticus TaxID=2174486 RepID=A0ABV9GII5_9BACL